MAKSNSSRSTNPAGSAAAHAFDVPPANDQVQGDPPLAAALAALETHEHTEYQVVTNAEQSAVPAIISTETPKASAARQGDDTRPYCPTHQCLLRSTGSGDSVTFYSCPVPSCTCKEKRARPQAAIPRDPVECPNRTCVATAVSPQMYLELVPAKSNLASNHMECPACKFAIKVPRQQFAQMAERQRRRPPREDFADR